MKSTRALRNRQSLLDADPDRGESNRTGWSKSKPNGTTDFRYCLVLTIL